MSKVTTYMTGRALSLFLAIGFNILIVKVMVPAEYASYAVLVAGASLVNTAAGLGSQRLVPKVIGMAGNRMAYRRAIAIYRMILLARTIALLLVSTATFYFFRWSLGSNVHLGANLLIPYVIYSTFAALYLDVESASQSLNQQKLSRMVAIGEPLLRLVTVGVMALGAFSNSTHSLLVISCGTQAMATLSLGLNNFRSLLRGLRRDVADVARAGMSLREILHLGASAYIGGLAWIATGPPTLRLVAASVLPAQGIAVLSFVQSLGGSFQRYSPGFLVLPFVESQVMRNTSELGYAQKTVSLLGIVWKIDMIISLIAICAIIPASSMLLALIARPEFAPYGAYIGLVILPVPFGTVNRVLEVGSVYVNNFNAILKSSALTLVSLGMLFALKSEFGVIFILLIPIIDNILRCGALDYQLRQRGLVGVVNWRSLLSVTILCLVVTMTAFLTVGEPRIIQIGLSVLMTLVAIFALKLSGIVTSAETKLIADRLPAAAKGWPAVLFGKSWRLPSRHDAG